MGGLPASAEAALAAGLAAGESYVNIHNATNPGGEIRGFLENGGNPITVGNDTINNTYTVTYTQKTAHGNVTLNALDGSFTYTPDANFTGVDSFTYQAVDAISNTTSVNSLPPQSSGDDHRQPHGGRLGQIAAKTDHRYRLRQHGEGADQHHQSQPGQQRWFDHRHHRRRLRQDQIHRNQGGHRQGAVGRGLDDVRAQFDGAGPDRHHGQRPGDHQHQGRLSGGHYVPDRSGNWQRDQRQSTWRARRSSSSAGRATRWSCLLDDARRRVASIRAPHDSVWSAAHNPRSGQPGYPGPGHDHGGHGRHGQDLHGQRQQPDVGHHHHGAHRGGDLLGQRRQLQDDGDVDADGRHRGQHHHHRAHRRLRGSRGHQRQGRQHQHRRHRAGRGRHRHRQCRHPAADHHHQRHHAGPGDHDGRHGGHGQDLHRQRQQSDGAHHHHGAHRHRGLCRRRRHLQDHA